MRLVVSAIDDQLAVEEVADPRPGVHVSVGNPAGWEVDAVEARNPLAVELDRRCDERVCGSSVEQLPDQPRAVLEDVLDPKMRSVVRGRRQGEDQWKYWPPSMTIVWPVTKSAAGVQRKTTAPTTSSGP